MIILPDTYRFKVLNQCGQTVGANQVKVYAKRYKFDSTGALSYESVEATTLDNGSTIATGAYSAGTTQDNTSNKYIGGTFMFVVTAPASANGNITLFVERSTDAGSNFDTDGVGDMIAVLNFTTSGTKRKSFQL